MLLNVEKFQTRLNSLEQRRRQIALRQVRQDHDDRLAGELVRWARRTATAAAAPQEMPTSSPSSRASRRANSIGLVAVHLLDAVDDREIQRVRE